MNDRNLDDSAVDQLVTSAAEPPPLDAAQLRELIGDDAEFIRSIAESFASSSAQILASLRSGAANGDATQISKAAHALKGQAQTSTRKNFGIRPRNWNTRAANFRRQSWKVASRISPARSDG